MSHSNLLSSTLEPLDVELKIKEGEIPTVLSGFVFINSGAGTVNSGGLLYERKYPNGEFNQEFGSPLINRDGYRYSLYQGPNPNRVYSAEQMLDYTKKGAPFILETVETDSMNVSDHYSFPKKTYMWSLQFIPKKSSNNSIPDSLNAYILCTVIGVENNEQKTASYFSENWIFDAADLNQGPVAKLHHDELQFAFTIHSVRLDKAEEVSMPDYKIDIAVDYNEQIGYNRRRWLRKKVQSLIKHHVYPHFR